MKGGGNLKTKSERLVIGLSGASGVAYGIRALEALAELGIESHLVMTKPAEMTIGYETRLSPRQVAGLADNSWATRSRSRFHPVELYSSNRFQVTGTLATQATQSQQTKARPTPRGRCQSCN